MEIGPLGRHHPPLQRRRRDQPARFGQPECTLAQNGAAKLWALLNGKARKGYVNCLGALTGGQALQQAKAGVEAIYLSGWQVAADANSAAAMYPDQSLYPVDSGAEGGRAHQQYLPSRRSDPMGEPD